MIKLNIDQEKLIELCEKHKLKLLILHGSYATEKITKESDIDIGILSRSKIEKDGYFEILKDFADIFGDKFDPVFLNNTEPMICYQVALNGEPLFEAKHGDFAEFKIQSIARYMDTKKFRELEKHYVKRAIGKE